MAIVRADDVRYLVFGGGGGRGWAHLGALRALEQKRRTGAPLVRGRQPRGQDPGVVGVAGASVGALVAMCVALGATSDELRTFAIRRFAHNRLTLVDSPTADDKVPRLLDDEFWFYEKTGGRPTGTATGSLPEAGLAAMLGSYLAASPEIHNGRFSSSWKSPDPAIAEVMSDRYYAESIEELIGNSPLKVLLSEQVAARVLPGKIEELRRWLDGRLRSAKKNEPFIRDLRVFTRNPRLFRVFLANLQAHGGILPGRALQRMVEDAARHFGQSHFRDPKLVTFRQLHDERGVELAVTGTHLARRRGEIFSYRTTPDFAVAPAVSLSMRLPGLFKPVSVSQDPGFTDRFVMPAHFVGRWSDGGMINNLPLRAFPRVGSLSLDPRTLAFALTTTPPRNSGTTVFTNLEKVLNEYIGVYADQPIESQIELDSDKLQVVELKITELSTLDVAFNSERCKLADKQAVTKIDEFFAPNPATCFSITRDWQQRAADPQSVDFRVFEAVARAQFRSFFPIVSPAPLKIIPFKDTAGTHGRGFTVDIIARAARAQAPWVLIEAKASGDAALTRPQREGHPLLRVHGGLLINGREDDDDEEWRAFGDETVLPPTTIEIVRPGDLCSTFERLVESERKAAAQAGAAP